MNNGWLYFEILTQSLQALSTLYRGHHLLVQINLLDKDNLPTMDSRDMTHSVSIIRRP